VAAEPLIRGDHAGQQVTAVQGSAGHAHPRVMPVGRVTVKSQLVAVVAETAARIQSARRLPLPQRPAGLLLPLRKAPGHSGRRWFIRDETAPAHRPHPRSPPGILYTDQCGVVASPRSTTPDDFRRTQLPVCEPNYSGVMPLVRHPVCRRQNQPRPDDVTRTRAHRRPHGDDAIGVHDRRRPRFPGRKVGESTGESLG
jgi:hypothetical protein